MADAVTPGGDTTLEQSIAMLRAAVDGKTYHEVGDEHGISRTAVEKRIKVLAQRIYRTVGIEGLTDEGIAYINRLRAHRAAVLNALAAFEAYEAPEAEERPLRAYTDAEIAAAAQRVRAYSNQPLRDTALFYVLLATAARPLEIARLQVRDYLEGDGSVRRRSELRAEAAINGRARPLFFDCSRLDDALMPYLCSRVADPQTASEQPYLGLEPRAPLFAMANGEGFTILCYGEYGQRRHLCRPILETYRKIFRYALPDATPRSIRATLVSRMYARGADDAQVGLILGITQRSAVREMFPRPRPDIAELMRELI